MGIMSFSPILHLFVGYKYHLGASPPLYHAVKRAPTLLQAYPIIKTTRITEEYTAAITPCRTRPLSSSPVSQENPPITSPSHPPTHLLTPPKGTTSGIGYATASVLASASPSNHVIMTARSSAKGQAALEELRALKPAGALSFVELDVASDESIAAAASSVERQFGRLDVLINNAGIVEDVGLAESARHAYSRDDLRRVFDTNTLGPYLLTQALEPLLRRSAAPRVVNVSTGLSSVSMRHDHGNPAMSPVMYDAYRMSKSALNMMSACYRWYLRDAEGARVHAYCPGYVVSNLSGPGDVELRKATGAGTPESSAYGILDILAGKRDGEEAVMVTKDGRSYQW